MNRRRTFLIASCAATALVPLVGLGQQPRMPKVGLLFIDDPEPAATNIREALREAGYIDKKQIHIEIRTARGNADLLLQHATELVRANVDVILAVNTGAVQAAMQATTTIPIVMIAGAPLETGLVKSLNRPGGNVTGVTPSTAQLSAKTLEVMRDMLPSLRRIAVLVNANDSAFGNAMLEQVQSAARSIKVAVHGMSVRAEELDTAFAVLEKMGAQAVMSQPSLPRARVVELALKHRIPLIAPNAAWPVAGAFMSYSGVQAEFQRKAATYVVRILKGANPATIAVEHVTHYELVINLKTTRALGLTVPPSVLARADRVIE